ncbi:MAG: D-amino acid aminotransferase [Desulfobacteraceae bacterium]|nr:D-amino acid aminotransferase [Desulfobacteraceae bacterium]
MPELAYVNGRIMPIEEAKVPINDRGYHFADAVYEFISGYHGRLFAFEAHLDRLERSLRALSFPPISRDSIREAIEKIFQAAALDNGGVYLQISRGVAPRNHPFPINVQPQIIITVRSLPETPRAYLENGIHVITVTDIRWGRCDIKTVQLLPNVLARQQALDAGAQDAIFISPEGVVREATSSNLFIVKDNTLQTHPLTPNILPGVTRGCLLEICREEGIPVQEIFFNHHTLLSADEVFITSTVAEVLPVTRIDGRSIGAGCPGPLTQRLRTLLETQAGKTDSINKK